MPLLSGTRIGPYEIVGPLGAGGMGEVYRALDTQLGRSVAIKIVPPAFATDPERVARFQREARLLAALNHPNIAAIYGVEESVGVRALVLEFIEGETLADRLQRGPMPVSEAIDVARQIALALDAAHERGIVHRDLKPANVSITRAGVVKVLDFGLAKAVAEDGTASDVTQSPTATIGATKEGAILGTAAYMSPEQARGRLIDKRTDIWAFGCIVFELLTGQAAFGRETISDTVAAILEREPAWERLPQPTSARLRALMVRCLEKDPARRLRDIGDARFDLDDSDERPPTTVAGPNRRGTGRRGIALAALAAAGATLLTGAIAWKTLRPAPAGENNHVLRLNVQTPSGVAYDGGELAISPDGTRIVYPAVTTNGVGRLYLRDLSQLNATPIADTDDGVSPFFSPDGEWLAFVAHGTLKKTTLRARSEPPITICDVASLLETSAGLQGASWGPDGTIVFSAGGLHGGGLYRIPAAGGVPAILTKPDPAQHEQRHAWPTFLPGGKAILFSVLASGQVTFTDARIAVASLESGEHHTVIERGYHPHFVASGHVVYTQDDSEGTAAVDGVATLTAVPFDVERLVVSGPPVPLIRGVRGQTILGNAYFDVSPNGALIYAPGGSGSWRASSLVWVDRQGREEAVPAPPHAYLYPRISPDGSRVAVNILEAESDIWIWDLARRTLNRLTRGGGLHVLPAWTPDGRRIAFASRGTTPAAPYNLFWQDADGAGSPDRLGLESATSQFPYGFSRDGTRLLLQDTDQTSTNVRMLALDNTRRTTPLLQGSFSQRAAALSPDGHFIAFQSSESGRGEIYVRPFPNVSAGRWQVSTSGGDGPVWDPSGRGLFYVVVSGDTMHVMNVSVQVGATFEAGIPRELFAGKYVDFYGLNYDISRDGRHLLMVKSPAEGDRHSTASLGMIVVMNWQEELKARVRPSGKGMP